MCGRVNPNERVQRTNQCHTFTYQYRSQFFGQQSSTSMIIGKYSFGLCPLACQFTEQT
ncbi:hypothetical protein D3C74_410980 [compost metagenome]